MLHKALMFVTLGPIIFQNFFDKKDEKFHNPIVTTLQTPSELLVTRYLALGFLL